MVDVEEEGEEGKREGLGSVLQVARPPDHWR